MNYFGHAAVATLCRRSPRFVLGAMLPDLIPMAGVAVPPTFLDEDLNRGLRFHLETDALFHGTTSFVELNRKALAELRQLGISRGPARACAHVGVEMWLDAELARDDRLYTGYVLALREVVSQPELLRPLPAEDSARAQQLCAHLLGTGSKVFEPSAERFALRLGRILAPRKRLAPSAQELTTIADYLSGFTTAGERCAELMQELAPLWHQQEPLSASDA